MSYAEELFMDSLKCVVSDNEKILKNYRPIWLKNDKTNRSMEYDFYLPNLKIAFEIQGQHHYDDISQIDRDNLKFKLSEFYNVALFRVSIFQIDPYVIRKKIKNYSFTVHRNFNLKEFNREKYEEIYNKVKSYRKNIINKYGKTDCQKPYKIDSLNNLNNLKIKIENKKMFYMNIKHKRQACKFVKFIGNKVLIETTNKKNYYINLSKFNQIF